MISSPTKKIDSWVTKSNDTVYPAITAGFVTAFGGKCVGYSDSSETPNTQRAGDGGGYNKALTMPVKKGDFWKVINAATVYWIPLK